MKEMRDLDELVQNALKRLRDSEKHEPSFRRKIKNDDRRHIQRMKDRYVRD